MSIQGSLRRIAIASLPLGALSGLSRGATAPNNEPGNPPRPSRGVAPPAVAVDSAVEPELFVAEPRHDPIVEETEIQVPNDGLLVLAAKATELGDGLWRYEYALENDSSLRAVGSFSVCFWCGDVVNMGFADADAHCGDQYNCTDWTPNIAQRGVHWSTLSYAVNPNANALRIGRTYYYWFDSHAPPWTDRSRAQFGLFTPGVPQELWANTLGPGEPCATDADHDGEGDCFDFCPGTPASACTCQGFGMCCWGCTGPCEDEYPNDECVADGGTPDECGDPRCKNGCPLLDMDNDGDRDLADFAEFQRCFSGASGDPGYVAPTQECVNRLDIDEDQAIGLGDYKQLFELGLLGE